MRLKDIQALNDESLLTVFITWELKQQKKQIALEV